MTALAPCAMCGIGTDQRVEPVGRVTPAGMPVGSYLLGLCDPCLTLDPESRFGVGVRAALRVIGRPEDDPDAGQAFMDAGIDVSHVLYQRVAAEPGADVKPGRKPWAHVPKALKADLKTAYAAMLRKRVTATVEPPTPQPPDAEYPQGCLACGIGRSLTWHGPLTTYGLTRGPEMVTGVVCQECVDSLVIIGGVGERWLRWLSWSTTASSGPSRFASLGCRHGSRPAARPRRSLGRGWTCTRRSRN